MIKSSEISVSVKLIHVLPRFCTNN